jgi:hypothetical protein
MAGSSRGLRTGIVLVDMRGWLKLVGTADWKLPELWAIERRDLLREARFSELHPPDPSSRGDHLVYHAVGYQRIVAVVEVLDDEPSLDPHPSEWEKKWPLILRVQPLLRISRVSAGPLSSSLGELPDRSHQGFVPLTEAQLRLAEAQLQGAGGS